LFLAHDLVRIALEWRNHFDTCYACIQLFLANSVVMVDIDVDVGVSLFNAFLVTDSHMLRVEFLVLLVYIKQPHRLLVHIKHFL